MIQAYHIVLTAYGFWLPNDPRGSGSEFVASKEIFRFGPARTVQTRVSIANKPHDDRLRRLAKNALRRPPVRFTGKQARAVGCGFAISAQRLSLQVYACAILPDHAHLVLRRSNRDIEAVIARLKADASRRLIQENLHPFSKDRSQRGALPSVWAARSWKVFLETPGDVMSRIRYVEQNPVKAGLKSQRWSFVVPHVQRAST